MKHRNLITAAVLVLFTSLAFAKSYEGHHGHERGGERIMKHLKSLDLSSDQESAIKTVLSSSKAASKELRKEKRELFKQMHSTPAESLTSDDIDRYSNEFGRLSAAGMRQRLDVKTAIAKILTPEQREQLAEERERKREEMREHRKKRYDG